MKRRFEQRRRLSPGWLKFKTTTAAFVCLVLWGCSESGEKTEAVIQVAAHQSANTVVIKGSNTVGEELAPRLIDEYKRVHPEVTMSLETKGSGSGFWGLIAGVCDIAAASRGPIKDEEQQADVHGVELKDNLLGSYSVAVVVNPANPVANLSKKQVADIFTGSLQNWKDIGGHDATIHLYLRNPISGTYLGFRELAVDDKPYSTNNATELNTYVDIVQAVAKDPNGIGYSSPQLAAKLGGKTVTIDGNAPDVSSVNSRKYPYARALHLYTDKSRETSATRNFVEFAMSSRGQQILDEMGFTPHP
jgi:phosphate transport system substrate-binding protein